MNKTNSSRRHFTVAASASLAGLVIKPSAAQGTYPNKPIRWIVGFPVGGGSDFLARTVAHAMSEQMGQPIIVENRPGAGATIGASTAARAAPDGYTLWSGDLASLVFNPMIYNKVPYKVSDFQPVGMMARFNMVIATGLNTGIDTMPQAVDAIRKAPGKLSYGSVGAGTPHHFAMELLKKAANLDIVHVPYRGLAPVVQDLIGGQIQFAPIDTAGVLPLVNAGKLKPLALMSKNRLPAFPNVPTLAELGFQDVEMYPWQGLLVHTDTPKAVVDVLAANLVKVLNRPDVRKSLVDFGLEVTPSPAQAFGAYIAEQTKFWASIVQSSGVKIDI